jgi:hypothetical protein
VRTLARHLRANTVAYLAIFVALGGTSYAAIAIPNNSVGNKQLKKDAVDSKKVKNKTLLKDDFNASTLPAGAKGVDGVPGTTGPQGNKGNKGDQGDKGPNGDQGAPGTRLTESQSVTSLNPGPPHTDILATDTVLLTAPALVTTAATRVHAAAVGSFVGDADSTATCVLKINSTPGVAGPMGQASAISFPVLAFTAPSAAEGSVNVAAGSHVVTFECKDASSAANTGVEFDRGDLRVTTAAQ